MRRPRGSQMGLVMCDDSAICTIEGESAYMVMVKYGEIILHDYTKAHY